MLPVVVTGILVAVGSVAATSPDGASCLVVENTAPFWVAGRVESRARNRTDFRLGAGEQQRICVDGSPDADGRLHFVIKNALAMPVFMCRASTDTYVTISSQEKGGKTRTFAVCR
jgi:hypothetical protein